MKLSALQAQVALGEDSRRQFKLDVRNLDSLASELAAFANCDGGTFVAVVHRKPLVELEGAIHGRLSGDVSGETSGKVSGIASGKTSGKIEVLMRQQPDITIPQLAAILGITERSVQRNIQQLQNAHRIKRVGPAKGGHWEVLT